MSKYFLLIFCLLLLPLNEEAIEWHDALKLDWNNFRGEPDSNNNAVAITASGLTFGYSLEQTNGKITSFQANVKAHFYPDKSWYKIKQVNETILMHERLHFDITEWHARQLRQQMAQLEPSQNIGKTLDNLYYQMSQTLRNTQSQYDLESDHSRNIENQFLWQEKVAKELKKLERFKE